MDDVGLVQTVLDLTSLGLLDSLGNVHRNRTSLRVRHQALRTEHAAQTADNAHDVRGRDNNVELEEVFLLDALHQVLSAYDVSAGSQRLVSLRALGEHRYADVLAGAVGQYDRAADLLVSVTGVNAQLNVQLNGLVELGLRGGNNGGKRLSGIVQLGAVDRLCAVYILFTFMHNKSSLSGNAGTG